MSTDLRLQKLYELSVMLTATLMSENGYTDFGYVSRQICQCLCDKDIDGTHEAAKHLIFMVGGMPTSLYVKSANVAKEIICICEKKPMNSMDIQIKAVKRLVRRAMDRSNSLIVIPIDSIDKVECIDVNGWGIHCSNGETYNLSMFGEISYIGRETR